MSIKYTINKFNTIYTRKTVLYNNNRLKTILIIQLIDTFLSRYIIFNKDKITLNTVQFRKIYGNNYKRYIEYLIDNNFIYLYKNYSSGRHSKIYKLTDNVKENKFITTSVKVPQKIQNKINLYNTNTPKIENYIKDKLINDLHKINIDYDNANYWIENNITDEKPLLVNSANILKIHKKDLYYSFDKFGRFHTNFTNLKKHIRENYLTINGNKLKEIDIVNSQPFFLYILMKKEGFTNFDNFDSDVMNGVIYDKIMQQYNLKRKEVKVNIYSVLFGRNMTKRKWDNIFNNLYPNVYKWITEYKKKHKNYKIIAQTLQSIEADFIFNNVIPQVIAYNKNIPLLTVHDSVIVPDIYYEDVEKIFKNALNNIIN